MVFVGSPHPSLPVHHFTRTTAALQRKIRSIVRELSEKRQIFGSLQQEADELRKANAVKQEYIGILHAAIFGLGREMASLTASSKGSVGLATAIGNAIEDTAAAYIDLISVVEDSEIFKRQKSGEEEATEAARMNAEAAAQEARDARNKTQTAAEKVQTAQREFEDKVARAQAVKQAMDSAFSGLETTVEERAAAKMATAARYRDVADAASKVETAEQEAKAAVQKSKAAGERAKDKEDEAAETKRQTAHEDERYDESLAIAANKAKTRAAGDEKLKITKEERRGLDEVLRDAAYKGWLTTVQALMARGAKMDTADWAGRTPLMLVALSGYSEIAEVLINHGADIHATSANGWTALMEAACWGHADVVRMLISEGASINVVDIDERTALDWAYRRNRPVVFEILKEAGAKRSWEL